MIGGLGCVSCTGYMYANMHFIYTAVGGALLRLCIYMEFLCKN